ncbi:MAG: hypothetical protein ABIO70_09675 [Pseudomonadota bacterium]
MSTTPSRGGNKASRGAAGRHHEILTMTTEERRDRAADILAEGVLRLLARERVIQCETEHRLPDDHEDGRELPVLFRLGTAAPGEAK